jgi:alpha-glucosidase (family GH31 glycosyl hydrolase)
MAMVRETAKLHNRMGDRIYKLAKHTAETGEPIVRPLSYSFPDQNYGGITDQFMLGADIMVAPVVRKGVYSREVVIPPGQWKSDTGNVYKGPMRKTIDAPLSRLPYFKQIEQQ